jgi:GR25 family glycosyltransferase involved in LPS biosynthesis
MQNPKYSIGVVTYHARFESYFMPLIENLARIFPDKEILCVINGHNEKTLQIQYLDKVTQFMRRFPNVRYLTNDIGQSLSKCWNHLMILAPEEKVIILSDDVYVGDFFREQIEKVINKHEMFLINRTFCHFVMTKNTIREVGWFEERLPRIGWEDTDYRIRMKLHGADQIPSEKILGSLNLSTDTDGSDWENDPKRPATKYTHANEDFFKTKWITKHYNPEKTDFEYEDKDPYYTFSRGENWETPQFYDLSVLDKKETSIPTGTYKKNKLKYLAQKSAFVASDAVVTSLRKTKHLIKKIRQATPAI